MVSVHCSNGAIGSFQSALRSAAQVRDAAKAASYAATSRAVTSSGWLITQSRLVVCAGGGTSWRPRITSTTSSSARLPRRCVSGWSIATH